MRPSRAIWAAWTLALLGGIAVLVATGLALNDPCAGGAPCTSTRVTVASAVALAGTVVAVVGVAVAAYLTLHGSEAGRD